MSRIGNQPVSVPSGVTVHQTPGSLVVKGPRGELTLNVPDGISVSHKGEVLVVARKGDHRFLRGAHGAFRAHAQNAITGVNNGWSKTLELSGVGFRASLSGSDLVLTVGFSHPVTIKPPAGITFTMNEGKIVASGIDRHTVGQIAADIRSVKPPEPYKGKGIKYVGEHVRKKAGKAKAVGGAPGAK
ncbi:50S ribosomal protein L6 [Candidatus Gottesmanbacteria bacterium RIFCSPHIGHO2_01_FULL_46_14]|uniref:Large ribosomal subunit protein uL6 n=3 Tax=Candidatus Gottesmaniibacteriota TaxID=1752720 RepID=A0A1F5ZS47_9BACT|nr:MAG: 50S ribosomal protein L6 [Candidatus Gottesmanbacteria bacterium GW2011_GWA1_47_8]OGG15241.1 MAG: 50S ribosomal protein L6 [Candidatus Gottesmanbacteria bacterium RIFCSPHIGHO2_01_FULL_46_14]OGG28654.1 MAG: 50S ribosomal protein L6 [Candidatus Gottesmanbacteria bacterium RIFCSPLOWO2_01_FULL_46_21]